MIKKIESAKWICSNTTFQNGRNSYLDITSESWKLAYISGPITEVMNILADFHKQGYQYCSLNSYHSAISSVHDPIDGHGVWEHPLVSRLMKWVFNDRPTLPRYSMTVKVQTILNYLDFLGVNQKLTLTQFMWKTVMHAFSINLSIQICWSISVGHRGVTARCDLHPISLAKQFRAFLAREGYLWIVFSFVPW